MRQTNNATHFVLTCVGTRMCMSLHKKRGYDGPAMSLFRVNVKATNPSDETRFTPELEALVDTGSQLTWLPADVLRAAGITPRRTRTFLTATQAHFERPVGYAILGAEGYQTADEVVFAEPGDLTLLGVRTLDGFGVTVDNINHRFVATTTIVAGLSATHVSLVAIRC